MSKETKHKARPSCIIYADFAVAADLMSDAQNGRLFKAILLFITGEVADLQDDPVLNMAWLNILERLKKDAEKYWNICEINKRNGREGLKARYSKKTASDRQNNLATASDRTRPLEPASVRHDIDIDIDIDNDNDIEEKKTAPPAVASGATVAAGAASLSKTRSFKSWTEQDLIDSVDACIAQHPDFAPYKDAFVGYWGEKLPNGRPRLCAEKSWETPRRMATWQRRADEYGSSGRTGRPPAGQPDGIENLFEQAKKTTR